MEEAIERHQIKFSVQTVSFAIEAMLKHGKAHLFYSNLVDGVRQYTPCVLRKHVYDVVRTLQNIHRGVVVISRTPGGIVVDKI